MEEANHSVRRSGTPYPYPSPSPSPSMYHDTIHENTRSRIGAARHDRQKTRGQIPRPANAFLLFRSDFLKKKSIPKAAESRQQVLSKAISLVWNAKPEEEKNLWKQKAAEVAKSHAEKYPGYKYKPAQREKKAQAKNAGEEKDPDVRAARLVQAYCPHVEGPPKPPARPRRKQAASSSRKKGRSVHEMPPPSNPPSRPTSAMEMPGMQTNLGQSFPGFGYRTSTPSTPSSRPSSRTSSAMGWASSTSASPSPIGSRPPSRFTPQALDLSGPEDHAPHRFATSTTMDPEAVRINCLLW